MKGKYDFSGYATRNNLTCSDGRVICRDAFRDQDGVRVPLVWQHQHNDPENVLGHAILENRQDGVYAYCTFNNSQKANDVKELVKHGDIDSLSIWANHLKQKGSHVLHGAIKEVSLVLAGANPGAYIDNMLIQHSDGEYEELNDEAEIWIHSDHECLEFFHADSEEEPEESDKKEENKDETIQDVINSMTDKQKKVLYYLVEEASKENTDEDDEDEEETEEGQVEHADGEESGTTVQDVIDGMTEEQKKVLYYLVALAAGKADDEEGESTDMKHNVFDNINTENDYISHEEMAQFEADVFSDIRNKRCNSLKDAVMQHSADYGIDSIDILFPDAKTISNTPEFIKRNDSWVSNFMGGTRKTPFSRVKSVFANITAEEARAKGYVKGKKKLDEVFTLLKRTTDPQTVYKKQKLDRDDIIDITDFDVVAFIKMEMRWMLDEEIARAALIGDGRTASAEDKIKEDHIRPIWKDDDLYTIKASFKTESTADEMDDVLAKEFITNAIKARKQYKGSGTPTLYTTEDVITACLLLEDKMGRTIYDSVEQLATKLRVKEIVPVEVMEGATRTGDDTKSYTLDGIIVNPIDYNFGANQGGEVNMFDDFDIDYNQQKYLLETRCSGALVKPYSAIVVEHTTA